MMRFLLAVILAILLAITLSMPCCASSERTFGGPALSARPFYAETDFVAKYDGHTPVCDRAMIWYRDSDHYRFEFPNWMSTRLRHYFVRNGGVNYTALANQKRPESAKWGSYPVCWLGDPLDVGIQHKWRVRDPVLLRTEKMRGVRVELWRCYNLAKHPGRLYLWMSKDPRFPFVMKVESTTAHSSLHYEVVRLRLDSSIPSYLLTSQVHPEAGPAGLLKMQFKPLWIIILWYVLILLSYVWLIRSMVAGKGTDRRIVSIACAGAAVLGLLWITPRLDHYWNSFAGLPALFIMGGIVAAALFYCIKRWPLSGNIRLFAGMRWPVFALTLAAAVVALVLNTSRAHALASLQFGLILRGLPFLPQTLASVVVYSLPWAALEEVVFRGYMMGALERRFSSPLFVNLLQAIAFTIEHISKMLILTHTGPSAIIGLIFIFMFGIIFGELRLKYRNLAAPWLVHSGYNIGIYYALNAGTYSLLTAIGSL